MAADKAIARYFMQQADLRRPARPDRKLRPAAAGKGRELASAARPAPGAGVPGVGPVVDVV